MADGPSWLTEESSGAAAPAPAAEDFKPATESPAPTSSSSGGAPVPAPTAEVSEEEIGPIIFTMRMMNLGVSIALIVCSIMSMLGSFSVSIYVLGAYAIVGGVLICCYETQLKFLRVMIAVNFGFMFNAVFRFMFYILLATVSWGFDNIFGMIVAGCLAAVAIYNTYVLCAYPGYRKAREKLAIEEDKRIQERINKETKKQALRQLMK